VNFSEINGELVYGVFDPPDSRNKRSIKHRGFQSGQKLYAAYLNKNDQKPMQEGVSATTTSVSLPLIPSSIDILNLN
jgi:hypothetical protein